MNARDPQAFLGTGWAFPPRFLDGGTVMVSGTDDIRESLRILLSTAPGERVMRPDFGCGLRRMVFESFDDHVAAMIAGLVRQAIREFETRIALLDVAVSLDGEQRNLVRISIDYRVRATNTAGNLVFPFYLGEEARG